MRYPKLPDTERSFGTEQAKSFAGLFGFESEPKIQVNVRLPLSMALWLRAASSAYGMEQNSLIAKALGPLRYLLEAERGPIPPDIVRAVRELHEAKEKHQG